MKEKRPKKPKPSQPSKFSLWWKWPLIVLILSFTLSFAFGVLSEYILSDSGIIVCAVVILVFIFIAIISDMVGVAITAASLEPFRAMAARKMRGAKESIKLIQNKEKVASVSADIIGDICGILSGAAGMVISFEIISNFTDGFVKILLASLVSAVIASLTIFGKALCKKYAIKHCEKIILILGKILSIFHKQSRKSEKKSKKHAKNDEKSENNERLNEITETNELTND